jgi:hypothetical protein
MSKYILLFILSLVFGLSSLVSAGIVRVPQDQPSIQAGINAAANGDTVLVADSTYYENINFNGKAITVASYMIMDNDSTHRDSTIINGSQPTNPDIGSVVSFVSGEDTNSVIYGFTITGGTGTLYSSDVRIGGGIYYKYSGAFIIHNKIVFNSVNHNQDCSGGGIGTSTGLHDLHQIVVKNNIIESNTITGGRASRGGGISIIAGKIIGNRIRFNSCNATISNAVGGAITNYCDTTFHRTLVIIDSNIITHNLVESTQGYGIGGGVDIQMSNVHLTSNLISHNTGSSNSLYVYGCGIRLRYSKAISIIKDNIISHNNPINSLNTCGGGLVLAGTRGVTIQGNDFINNTADWGGGIYEEVSVGSIISGNRFYSNTANGGGGGIFLYDASPEIFNNLIVNNNALLNGGGIDAFDPNSQPQIINNTIVADTAGLYGGGICINSDSVIVMNTILWGNSAPTGGQIDTTGGKPRVVYCDVQGGWTGTGNINLDPQFVIGDSLCHLPHDPSNPCVNTGADSVQINGQWYYCPTDDYEGDERPYMGRLPDMGADETQVPVGIEPHPIAGIPKSYALSQNYPNPFNPSTTIEFALPKSEFVNLKIYNILGEQVANLVSEKLTAGNYKYQWNVSGLASGVYFYKLETGKFSQIRKMLLLQ